VQTVGRPLAELLSLDGRVAIVTGAGHGLGLAAAARLAEAGAAVVLNDLDASRVEASAASLREAGRDAIAVAGDVADADAVDVLVARSVEAHARVDVLVNNAGIWPREPFLEADPGLWRRTLDVNLTGQLLVARAVARRLVEQGDGGAIVNIASIAATVPHPDDLVAYGASKAGVVNATRTLAKALAPHGIRVNAILPGGMETPGVQGTPRRQGSDIPLGHRADPDEVATAVLFLASPLAAYVTGAELVVDGGAALV
jgi:2-dehydro-3-deoxy-D-gluconate 5-dehydrogenase